MIDAIMAAFKVPAHIEQAFRKTPRHYFLPGVDLDAAYKDDAVVTSWTEDGKEPLSSSSQPSLMAAMLDCLDLASGHNVLEIGTGTGYNAALLAAITGSPSRVYSVDVAPEFVKQARSNLEAQGTVGITLEAADGWFGWPAGAPYDSIIVTACAHDIAPAWFDQLKDGGRIVVPWGAYRLMTFVKKGETLELLSHQFCGFMRMRGEFDWRKVGTDALQNGAHLQTLQTMVETSAPSNPAGSLEDLVFFLSLYVWPRSASVVQVGGRNTLLISDQDYRGSLVMKDDVCWQLTGPIEDVSGHVAFITKQWHELGAPGPGRLKLTGALRREGEGEARPEDIIRRQWFDYRVSWPI